MKTLQTHISRDHLLSRFKEGVKFIKPAVKTKDEYANCRSLNRILDLPFSVYFDNSEHAAVKVNEVCANICGFESTHDAIGRSVFDFTTKESAKRSVENQREIMQTGQMKIIEDSLIRNDDVLISFIGISYPWYSYDNKIIGVFGCSIVINQHSIAQSLSQLYHLGLLTKQRNFQGLTSTNTIDNYYFSPRQRQCIELILKGMSPKKMGHLLCLSHRTVEHYIASIKNKLDVSTKAEMIVKLNDWLKNLHSDR